MCESEVGWLSPCTRQNAGRFVRVWFAGVTSVPEVTTVAAVTVVLPSNVSAVRSPQARRLPSPPCPSRASAALAASSSVSAAAMLERTDTSGQPVMAGSPRAGCARRIAGGAADGTAAMGRGGFASQAASSRRDSRLSPLQNLLAEGAEFRSVRHEPSIDARSARDLAHPPALEVAYGLDELVLAVHHEGPVVRHALAQRLSRQEQQPRLASAQPDCVTGTEHRELPFGHLALTHARRALEYVSERILIGRDRDGHVGALIERPVLVDDRRLGVDHGLGSQRLTGHHAHPRLAVRASGLRNLLRRHFLVPRTRHLQASWEVDPDLEPVHPPALLADAARRHFGMTMPAPAVIHCTSPGRRTPR